MIKTLAKEIKEFKTASILTPLFMILEVIMEMFLPMLMANIVDACGGDGNLKTIYVTGAWMLVLAGVSLFGGVMGGKYGARASTGFARNLRKAMFRKIQTYSFSNLDKYSTAGLVTRMTTDVTNVQNAYQMILRMFVRAPSSLIVAVIMTLTINARLATVYLVAVAFLAVFLGLIIVRATRYFKQVFQKYDDLNASVQENINGIRVVKSYVREEHEKTKFTAASGMVYKMFLKAEKIVSYNNPLMMLAVYSCILLISWLGAHMIVQNTLTTGELMSLLTYCMNILMSLMMLSMVFVMATMSSASVQRIAEVLNEQSDLRNPEHPDYEIPDGSIRFEHVNFSYRVAGGEPVLKDVDLEIHSGETIGIIGGTGSSKSSFVSLISRLYDVTEGVVKVGGKDVRTYDLETLRDNVAVVLQKNVLFSGTILDNLRWGDKNATEADCIRACKLACADEFIQKLPDGYETYIEQGGTNVSGGQKQRLCIARALLKKPKILILDDSTSAVDTATDARIQRAFAEEIPGTTKLIIAQRISSVQSADRIIVLDNGKVDGIGTHEELLQHNSIYRDVYESQTSGSGDFDEKVGEA